MSMLRIRLKLRMLSFLGRIRLLYRSFVRYVIIYTLIILRRCFRRSIPQKQWLIWEANEKDSNSAMKRDAITNYMAWVVDQPWFKVEVDKLILDYIDFGNAFVTVDWLDNRMQTKDKTQIGYVGPVIKRISPLDMIMNPTSENFIQSPKIVRSIISMGELAKLLHSMTTDDNRVEYQELYTYLKDIRFRARTFQGDWIQRDHLYSIDGFSSFRAYLLSDFVEVLTFYGDYYDYVNDVFEENRVITVVDLFLRVSSYISFSLA